MLISEVEKRSERGTRKVASGGLVEMVNWRRMVRVAGDFMFLLYSPDCKGSNLRDDFIWLARFACPPMTLKKARICS